MTRPRLCTICHDDATWAVEEMRPFVAIARDGGKRQGCAPHRQFYCDDHIEECP